MDYAEVQKRDLDVVLSGIRHFVPSEVLDCGQSFRWSGSGDSYSGIAHGRWLTVELKENELILKNVTLDEFNAVWRDYFDLGRDYGALRKIYAAVDITLKKATEHFPGLRIMKQDPWETLVTFILSQNSNIPRIKGMVERLCERFDGMFPSPEEILNMDSLDYLRCGYRAPYILDAARRAADGKLDLDMLTERPTEEVKEALLQVHGVGPKVADCVLLYGFGRLECYPMDVWMKRVMANYYPDGFPEEIKTTAGIAQQFLFHYIRTV